MPVLVEYSQKLQHAVDAVIAPLGVKESQPTRRSGRSTFTDKCTGGFGGGSAEYKGYFKLVLKEVSAGNYQVQIIDGAYEGAVGQYPSVCAVGNCRALVYPWQSEVYSIENMAKLKQEIFAIKFSSDGFNGNCNLLREYLSIVALSKHSPVLNSLPSDTSDEAWCQLGRLIYDSKNNSVYVQQDNIGIAEITWYKGCGENVQYDDAWEGVDI